MLGHNARIYQVKMDLVNLNPGCTLAGIGNAQSLESRARTYSLSSKVLLASSAALGAGAVAWYIFLGRNTKGGAVSVKVVPGKGGGHLKVTGSF